MTIDKKVELLEAIVRSLCEHASQQAAGYDALASAALDDAFLGIDALDADAEEAER